MITHIFSISLHIFKCIGGNFIVFFIHFFQFLCKWAECGYFRIQFDIFFLNSMIYKYYIDAKYAFIFTFFWIRDVWISVIDIFFEEKHAKYAWNSMNDICILQRHVYENISAIALNLRFLFIIYINIMNIVNDALRCWFSFIFHTLTIFHTYSVHSTQTHWRVTDVAIRIIIIIIIYFFCQYLLEHIQFIIVRNNLFVINKIS